MQSFDDEALSFLGRCHRGREARQALQWARAAGFENVGLDLIYGLPGQSVQKWREALAEGVSFQPEHFSCYMLTYEPGTPLARMRQSGHVDPIGEDLAADLFGTTVDVLAGAGYEHYEISNFARTPELRSRHNRKYWDHTPYLGFGPAAHSFTDRTRRWNVKDIDVYIQRVEEGLSAQDDTETLTSRQLMIETIYLGLRTQDGIRYKSVRGEIRSFIPEDVFFSASISSGRKAFNPDGCSLRPHRTGYALPRSHHRPIC